MYSGQLYALIVLEIVPFKCVRMPLYTHIGICQTRHWQKEACQQ